MRCINLVCIHSFLVIGTPVVSAFRYAASAAILTQTSSSVFCSLASGGRGAENGHAGKAGLNRAGTDLYYYANGVVPENFEDGAEASLRASPSPRHGQAGGGWDGTGRPPRPGSKVALALSPRMAAQQGQDPEAAFGPFEPESDTGFTDQPAGLPRSRPTNELSESEAAAMTDQASRPATLYTGPADRSNQAAAGYLRNQGFTFPTMLSGTASPGQQQLMQGAPRVRPCTAGGGAGEGVGRLPAGCVMCAPAQGAMTWLWMTPLTWSVCAQTQRPCRLLLLLPFLGGPRQWHFGSSSGLPLKPLGCPLAAVRPAPGARRPSPEHEQRRQQHARRRQHRRAARHAGCPRHAGPAGDGWLLPGGHPHASATGHGDHHHC